MVKLLFCADWMSSSQLYLLSSLKDRLKKLTAEKETVESHLKNEKDEKELYKVMLCSH